jgi:hypothetical protein
MISVPHAYHYLAASSLSDETRPHLTLATSSVGEQRYPHFFEGQVKQPRLIAELLTTVQIVVGSRFFTPGNALAKLIVLADPVVTVGGSMLRFEGFSSCCSTYVRVDLLPESYDGDIVGKGTTNVDFNAPMRAALARVRDAQSLAMSVGRHEFALQSGADTFVEKKVALPLRWIRGMLEVQSYQASMRKRLEVNGHEALRFFRSLPKTTTSKTPLWVVAGPFGLRMTTREEAGAIRIVDTSRLRVLEALLPKAQSLAVYSDDDQQANAWALQFPGARLTLVLSAEVWRGFSGEGQALRTLMRSSEVSAVSEVRANLQWQSLIRAEEFAAQLSLSKTETENALLILGVSGLTGFDVVEGCYFHRVLPFDLSMVEDMHPRLTGARKLLEEDAVRILKASPLEATVKSGDVEHRVREVEGDLRCTCPWFAKHQGSRGPCKHVLATESLTGQGARKH